MTREIPDVCIVGAGACGGLLAEELAEGGLSVVVLEAGPRYRPDVDFVNDEAEMLKLLWMDARTFRGRHPVQPLMGKAVGGGTVAWSAVCMRFQPEDFETSTRDGVGADWPLTYAELEPYMARVEREFGVAGPRGELAGDFPMPAHPLTRMGRLLKAGADKVGWRAVPGAVAINSQAYQDRAACNGCGFCVQGCIPGAKASTLNTYIPRAERAGARIVPQAMAIRVNLDRQGRARSVTYLDATGAEREQAARVIIVAAHSVETPRLLLLSATGSFPQGLANSSGLVGVNFMCHPKVSLYGRFPFPVDAYKGFNLANLVLPDFARTNPCNDYARGFTPESCMLPPMCLAMDAADLWGAAFKTFMQGYCYYAGFWICGEGLPNDRNTVTLDPEVRDRYRLPASCITHEWVPNDLVMLDAMRATARQVLEAAGADEIIVGPARGAHYMGTCRMGTDPSRSVVDPDCRAHDVPNLYICDTSVFVTSGTVNPTLTAMAIATRTADRLLAAARRFEV